MLTDLKSLARRARAGLKGGLSAPHTQPAAPNYVQRLAAFDWRSPEEARIEGLSFFFDETLGKPPSEDQLYVFKRKVVFEKLAEVLDGQPMRRVMELGIWNGGSALVLAALLQPDRFVAVDILKGAPILDGVLRSHPLGDVIRPAYDTSQDDEAKLAGVIESEFDGPLDLVIDDASHLYGLSRASFEILFPRLRPGGWYVLEDWGWAHTPEPLWAGEPSLAGLVFELQLAFFSHPEVISQVVVKREMVCVQKGPAAPVSSRRLSLDSLYYRHHRSPPLMA